MDDERLGGAEAGRRSNGADDEPSAAGAARREAVLRTYLVALLGSDWAGSRAERAMTELTALPTGAGGSVPNAASVRKAAQAAGLDALDAELRRIDRRTWRAVTGRRQCSFVARRLGGRADGRISADELDAFYRHLERCKMCAAIAGRFEAGEWYLQVELGSISTEPDTPAPATPIPDGPSSRVPEPRARSEPPAQADAPEPDVPVLPTDRPTAPGLSGAESPAMPEPVPDEPPAAPDPDPTETPTPAPAPEAQDPRSPEPHEPPAPGPRDAPADPRNVPRDRPDAPAAPVGPPHPFPSGGRQPLEPAPGFRERGRRAPPSPADKPAPPPARAGPPGSGASRRSERRSAAIVVLAFVAVVGAIAGVVVVSGIASKRHGPPLIYPLRESTTGRSSAGGLPAVSAYDAKAAFVVGGARFAIFVDPKKPWTAFTSRLRPAQGSRWALIAVRVRNLTRVGFDPRVLHYRLIVAGGATYYPDLGRGTGPSIGRTPRPLAVGALTQAELAFQIPNAAAGLQLAFDPTGKHNRVVVALGQ